MNAPRARLLAALALLLALAPSGPLWAQSGPQEGGALTPGERVYGLSRIWEEAKWNYARFDGVPALDWDSAYVAFIPQVLAADSLYDYYRTLQRFIALLGDGHTQVFLPPALGRGGRFSQPWIELRPVERRVVVTNVDTALVRTLPIGSEVLAVDGVPIEAHLATAVFPYVASGTEQLRRYYGVTGYGPYAAGPLIGPEGSPVRVTVQRPDGQTRTLDLVRDRETRAGVWARPRTPPSALPPVQYRDLGEGLAYVALNTFNAPDVVARFDSIAPALMGARGVVLDLRLNAGGNGAHGIDLLRRHLSPDSFRVSPWRTRVHNALYSVLGEGDEEHAAYFRLDAWDTMAAVAVASDPALPKVTAPIVVLTSPLTQSAAEDFLVYASGLPRLTVVGEPTGGTTGTQRWFALPGGGRARVLVKGDTYPDGRPFVGVGIQPDVPAAPTVEGVIRGHDTVLDRAVEVLRERSAPPRARD